MHVFAKHTLTLLTRFMTVYELHKSLFEYPCPTRKVNTSLSLPSS